MQVPYDIWVAIWILLLLLIVERMFDGNRNRLIVKSVVLILALIAAYLSGAIFLRFH